MPALWLSIFHFRNRLEIDILSGFPYQWTKTMNIIYCIFLTQTTYFFSPSNKRNDSKVGGAFILKNLQALSVNLIPKTGHNMHDIKIVCCIVRYFWTQELYFSFVGLKKMFYSNFACEIIPMWPRIENVNLLALTHQVHLKLSSAVVVQKNVVPSNKVSLKI